MSRPNFQTLGYEVVRELGSGGFGKVNLVREKATGAEKPWKPWMMHDDCGDFNGVFFTSLCVNCLIYQDTIMVRFHFAVK